VKNKLLAKIDSLPTIPSLVPSILEIADDPSKGAEDIVKLLINDQKVTANCMRLCNSAYFSRKHKVNNLKDASIAIGIKNLLKIVLTCASSQVMDTSKLGYGFRPNELWKHSVTTAIISQLVIKLVHKSKDYTLFASGLMHDVGKIILDKELEKKSDKVIELQLSGLSMIDIERELTGTTHPAIGAALLTAWSFPESIVSAAAEHHRAVFDGSNIIPSIIRVSNIITHMCNNSHDGIRQSIDKQILGKLGMTRGNVVSILKELPYELKAAADMMNLKS
jgi:putative nucleotidyltransferase with HDIG domain